MSLKEYLGFGKKEKEPQGTRLIVMQINDVGCNYPFHSPQIGKIEKVESGEVPFSQLSPTGIVVYILKQLRDRNLIDPERTEMPTILDTWGARCGIKSAENLEIHLVCTGLNGKSDTLSAALAHVNQQDPQELYGGCFPLTKEAADNIVSKIEYGVKVHQS